ncbi:hypothetical protein [Streptomyces sp. NBC_01235]|uniref:hypothetical protein n=1 Tax=Streptomyces sp. NBC_01235 TaxID=2903788 RepID=UPI002E134644|nr:hypothetical protein OG289_26665 [Streptomyces sp. NBC_01235]
MSAVPIEITPRSSGVGLAAGPRPQIAADPAGVLLVEDVEQLTVGSVPGCGEDNPYS